MLRKERGITLVALVITIIVLLILAGVTLAMISGQDGILTKAVNAKKDNELGAAKDEVALKVNELIAQYYEDRYVSTNTTTVTAAGNSVGAYVRKKFTMTTTTNKVTVNSSTTKTDGKVKLTYDGKTIEAIIDADTAVIGPWTEVGG